MTRTFLISLILLVAIAIGLGGILSLWSFTKPGQVGSSIVEPNTEHVELEAENDGSSTGIESSVDSHSWPSTPRPETEVNETDPFRASSDFNEFTERLEELEVESRGVDAYQRYRWLKTCREVESTGRLSPGIQEQMGLKAEAGIRLQDFCKNALPGSFNLADPIDSAALSAWTDEILFESSLAFTEERLESVALAKGHGAAVESALRILANSFDEGALLAALDLLVRHRTVAPPFNAVDASYLMYDPKLMALVAGALLCDRVGGCGSFHPLTLRHCLESRFGCYEPLGYVHAVEQTIPPLEFQAFMRLHQEALRHSSAYRDRP